MSSSIPSSVKPALLGCVYAELGHERNPAGPEEPGRRAERPACGARTPTPLPQTALSWLQARYSLVSLAVPRRARGSRPASPARLSRDQVLFPLSL